jgi:hypothetical protein
MNILVKTIRDNPDGFTVDRNGQHKSPKCGYFVGVTNNIFSKVTRKELMLLECQRNDAHLIHKQCVYTGGWKDDNKSYLDVSLHIMTLDKAKSLARSYGQKAIWDCNKKISLYL